MKKLLLLTILPLTVYAQQSTYFTDRNGQPAGTAWSYGNQTFLTDPIGRPMGSAATNTNRAPPAAITMPVEPLRIEPFRLEPLPSLELPSLR
jgi:hypothetical protein